MPNLVTSQVRDDDNRAADTSRLLNCFAEPVGSEIAIKSVLGTEAFADAQDFFLHDMIEVQGTIFAALGSNLISVNSDGNATTLASLPGGETVMSSHDGKVTIAVNGVYYVWDGAALQIPGSGRLSQVSSVEFLGQYTLLTEQNGREFEWTTLADPETRNALYFATAEGDDDNIVRGFVINGRYVLFKQNSREVWYQSGSDASAFSRVAGASQRIGLKAKKLICLTADGAFFIGDDNNAYLTGDGLSLQPISSAGVTTAIKEGTATSCFYYEDELHKFAVIRFSDRPAWVLDLSTLEWHERSETVNHTAWTALDSVKLGSDWYVGNDEGEFYKLVRNNADVSGALKRTVVSQTFGDGSTRQTANLIEIFGRMGYSNLGRDAQVMLRLSRDGAQTWTGEKWRSLGDQGEYDKRATWRAQGQFRKLTLELSITDPAEIPLLNRFVLQ